MKVLPFKIPKPERGSIVYQVDRGIYFYDKLHQHDEIQISLIIEGEGTLIVGDTVNYYKKGDMIVIGSNLPHIFKSDIDNSVNSHMESLFFTKHSFGDHFFELDELQELKLFFKKAKHGFKITSSKKRIETLFAQLKEASKFKRFILLLEFLKIASSCHYKSLSSFIYEKDYTDNEGHRMRSIFEYSMSHFNKNISLNGVAEVASMTKNAFCKYFKKRTGKTYFHFLKELRIENACKLLMGNNDFSIAEIAFQSGYNNISNFNRQFLSLKKQSPSNFRKLNQ